MSLIRCLYVFVVVAVLGLIAAPSAIAQQSNQGTIVATREHLRDELARLERAGASGQAAASLIRTRLESGDFQAGDRIAIRVEGEPQLTDTFVVTTGAAGGGGPQLELPQVGVVSLQGVLRSELKGRLETHLAQFLRNPAVQVQPLIRLLIDGEVVRPGYYAAAPQHPLADVITEAGGLTQRAKAAGMRVERGATSIWSGAPLRDALGRGYSIDQLNLRAGDRLFVPTRGDSERTVRIIGVLVTIPLAIFTITRLR
ncbi:MAG TPA: polysaccharide biosynthesis/export family protein [Gemmatimonadales bacterium]